MVTAVVGDMFKMNYLDTPSERSDKNLNINNTTNFYFNIRVKPKKCIITKLFDAQYKAKILILISIPNIDDNTCNEFKITQYIGRSANQCLCDL